MDERWSEVPDWPGYRVSAAGVVVGPRGRPLAGARDKNGYHCISLRRREVQVLLKVHRLVVIAFIGPIPQGMHVNHKNGVKDDNRVENLEIVTPHENVLHGYRVLGRQGRNTNPARGESHGNAVFTEDQVREIRRLYGHGLTQVKIAERFNTRQDAVSKIVRRQTWAHVA